MFSGANVIKNTISSKFCPQKIAKSAIFVVLVEKCTLFAFEIGPTDNRHCS